MNHYEVIKKFHVSEKAGKTAGLSSMKDDESVKKRLKPNYRNCETPKLVFDVDLNANKIQIKKAIEAIYATVHKKTVKVVKVNTIRIPTKLKRVGSHYGRTTQTKKAIVTFRPEDKNLITETA